VLAAAPNLASLRGTPGRFHQLVGDRRGEFALSLWGSVRLVFEPDVTPVPLDGNGAIDLIAVVGVRILDVIDYHE
jgi:toxin HigB-1